MEDETRTTIVVPTKLWIKFKIAVIQEGTSLQAKIRELIRDWLESKETKRGEKDD